MNTEIINQTKTYLHQKQMSQNEFASKLDMSGTTLSQLLKGEYPGDSETMLKRIAKEIGYSQNNWTILSTANFEAIKNLCLDAQEEQRMVLAYGDTGSGKTSALLHYAQKTPNCFYVLANVLMKPKDLLASIQKSVGADVGGTLAERLDSIVSRLEQRKFPLLIIDDCGKLENHAKCFGIIQLLYDRTEGRCGIVLSGTKRLSVYINKMAEKDVLSMRELKRRISYWQPLRDGVQTSFIKAVCKQHEITNPQAIQHIANTCTNHGDVKELIRNFNKFRATRTVNEDEQHTVISNLKINHQA